MTDDTDTPDDTDEGQDDDWTDGLSDGDADEDAGQQPGGEAADQQPGGEAADQQPGGEAADQQPGGEAGSDGDESAVQAYLLKGTLVLLVVLGVVATLQFYLSAQTAIRRFASEEFRPVFVAAFNLVVLLAVGVGVAQVVRRLG
jgi:hypothetical protein